MYEDLAGRMMALFVSNARSFGTCTTHGMGTVRRPYDINVFISHIKGEVGLGLVPITDQNQCFWAAIDIDTHGANARDLNIQEISDKIAKNQLPLIACRSRSGGVHCYVFFKEPADAGSVRTVLSRWAVLLGVPGVEIFPKQSDLNPMKDGTKPLGNWLNLPYYDTGATERYAYVGGKQVSLEYFLDLAEGNKIILEQHNIDYKEDYKNGPPCLERMLMEGVPEGSRNTAAFQAAVFLKRAFKDDWMDRLKEFNLTAMIDAPLPAKELRTVIGSVSRRDYQYKCREEPCKSMCDRDVCKTRQFGVTGTDTEANEIPIFDRVEKVMSTPIYWVIYIREQPVEMTTEQLYDYNKVRERIGEKVHILMPRMKKEDWDMYLREIMQKAVIREATSFDDVLFERLCRFLRKADDNKGRAENDRREDLLRRRPALIRFQDTTFKSPTATEGAKLEEGGGSWLYAFRAVDFIEHLRRQKALQTPEHTIHYCLQKILGADAKHDKLRIGAESVRNVWAVPEEMVSSESVPVRKYSLDF